MLIVTVIGVLITILFPHIYGVVENRLFKESGNTIPSGHFKWYHVYLGLTFGCNAFFAYALTYNVWFAIALFVYSPLALDWVWWTIRNYDFKKDPEGAPEKYNGETNPWHEQADWDNYGGFEIVGCYIWWYVFAAISIILFCFSLV